MTNDVVDPVSPVYPPRKNNPKGALQFYVTARYASSGSWSIDQSIKEYQVYSINQDGSRVLADFECAKSQGAVTCFSNEPLTDALFLLIGQTSVLGKTYKRLLSLTSLHPVAGRGKPLTISEFDVDTVDYILKRLTANPAYDVQNVLVDSNTTDPDPLEGIFFAYSEDRLQSNIATFVDYMVANPTMFLFLAKAPTCNSQLTFPTDGDWSQTGDYQVPSLSGSVMLVGRASATQFATSDSIEYQFDTDPRTSLFSDSSYLLLQQAGQDVIVYSKCSDSSDTDLSYNSGTKYATLTVNTNALPSLTSGQTSHLRMLAVKIDSGSYTDLQTACLDQTNTVTPSRLIQQFVPFMALLAADTDEGRAELGDWIGRSRCLCAGNFNPPLDSTHLMVGYHDNFSVSFPLGTPGIPVTISPLNRVVNTDQYGIAKLGSNEFQKGDVVNFTVDSAVVATCTIPASAQGLNLQTFRNGFFYDCYTGQSGDGCECPAHMIPDPSGKACVACGANQISVNKACQDCPPNQVQSNNTCNSCPAPTYYSSGACVACAAGFYSNDGLTCSGPCDADKVVGVISGTTYGCKSCPDGQIAVSYQCQACGVNQISSSNSCVSCAADQVVVNNACVSCPVGEIAYNGTCLACGLGQYVSLNQCVFCPSDKVVNTNKNGCESCPDGQTANNYACTDCPAGQVGTTGNCTACSAGYVAVANQCVLAAASCPYGTVAVDGVCTGCPAGTQANSLGSCSSGGSGSACAVNSDCGGGAYCSGTAGHTQAGTCASCPAGEKRLYLTEGCTNGQSGSTCDVYSDCLVLQGLSCNMTTKQCQ